MPASQILHKPYERLIITSTVSRKCQFVSRNQVFPLPVVYCSLYVQLKDCQFHP